MMPREKWTDERLDDLNKKVDNGFARVDAEIRELRREMNARFEKVDERFEALNRNLIAGLLVIVATILGSNAL